MSSQYLSGKQVVSSIFAFIHCFHPIATRKMIHSVLLVVFASLVVSVLSDPSPEPAELKPVYGPQPNYEKIEIPHCAKNTTKAWCLEDSEYPQYEIQQALERHYQAGVLDFYKDVLAKTSSSVDGIDKLNDEVYLCPSSTGYVQPLRAINVEGKWRTIVNRVESYGIKYTQTARVEECNVVVGTSCSLVPSCYQSKCVQKAVFHRFLVYDANEYTFPFSLEKFRLPGSCSCVVGAFHL
ncbi:hypothetical protein OUZ56_024702 [Daphnia magna]|uniref:Spaetzle domain-containing protein n=1 Tax=Daphnia magna TaxID=35525 RepID=A0ABQ9ZHP9_9CRUS|nr:hypothetical protein OUZ56_024702 [Daphnia magna]